MDEQALNDTRQEAEEKLAVMPNRKERRRILQGGRDNPPFSSNTRQYHKKSVRK